MLKLVMSELEYLSCIYYYTITSWLMLHWIGFKFNTWSSFVFDREFSEGTEKKLTSLEVLCVDTNAGCPLVLNPFNLRSRSNPNGSPVISEKRKWRTKCFDTETIFSNFQKKFSFHWIAFLLFIHAYELVAVAVVAFVVVVVVAVATVVVVTVSAVVTKKWSMSLQFQSHLSILNNFAKVWIHLDSQ